MKRVEIFKGRYPWKTVEIVSKRAQKHFNKGKLLAVQGEYDEAIREYERALKIEPLFTKAKTNLRFIYWMTGRLDLPHEFQRKHKLPWG